MLIKETSRAEVDMINYFDNVDPAVDGKFRVELDYQKLMNLDRDPDYLAPQYWIEPPKEEITINLNNVDSIQNYIYK